MLTVVVLTGSLFTKHTMNVVTSVEWRERRRRKERERERERDGRGICKGDGLEVWSIGNRALLYPLLECEKSGE